MWIRTQDKKELVDLKRFSVYRPIIIGGKKKDPTFVINGHFSSTTVIEVGKYFTQEEALLELDNIHKYMLENPNGIYEVQ